MEIPPEISIPICIEQGSVYHFCVDIENEDGTQYSGDRFFIVLNANPKIDELILLVTITKKIAEKEAFIKRVGESPDTLVAISSSDFRFLSVKSVINCNTVYPLSMTELIEKIKNDGKIFPNKLPKSIVNKLIRGVLESNQIEPDMKELVI